MYKKNTHLLKIIILSYNRLEHLDYLLSILKAFINKDVLIEVLDDNSSNKKKLKKLKKKYKKIFFKINKKNQGHDKNYQIAFLRSSCKYNWIIGDTINLNTKYLKQILKLLIKEKKDLIFLGHESRSVSNKCYFDNKLYNFIVNFSWFMSLTGTTIYSKKIAKKISLHKYIYKNFPALFGVLNNIKNINNYLIFDKPVLLNPKYPKKSYWSENIYKTFLIDLERNLIGVRFIPKKVIYRTIINHSQESKIFTFKSLIYLKITNRFTYLHWKKYSYYLLKYTKLNKIKFHFILIIPNFFIKLVYYIYTMKFKNI